MYRIALLFMLALSSSTFATVISPFAKNDQEMYQSKMQINSNRLGSYSHTHSNIQMESQSTNLCGHEFQNDYNVLIIALEFNDQELLFSNDQIYNAFFNENDSVSSFYKEATKDQINLKPALNKNVQGLIKIKLDKNHPGQNLEYSNEKVQLIRDDVIASFDKILNEDLFDMKSFDKNNNNIIESNELGIQFVIAGYEEAYAGNHYPNAVWAHQSSLFYNHTASSLFITQYAVAGEKLNHPNQQEPDQIFQKGIIAHELGHLLFCLPDLYEINENYRHSGDLGEADLMASGSWNRKTGEISGASPAHFSTFSLHHMNILDMNELQEIHSANDSYDIEFNNYDTNLVYNNDILNGYFLEARGRKGYDSALANEGVFITKVENKNGKYIVTAANSTGWSLDNFNLENDFYINITSSEKDMITLKTSGNEIGSDEQFNPETETNTGFEIGEHTKKSVGSGNFSFLFLIVLLILSIKRNKKSLIRK